SSGGSSHSAAPKRNASAVGQFRFRGLSSKHFLKQALPETSAPQTRVKKENQMSRGYPSMTALLALLAMAGYQNRDKIGEWIKAAQSKMNAPSSGAGSAADGGPPGKLGGVLAGTSVGGMLSGGLHDLVNSFKQAGHGEVADSWVGRGPNKPVAPPQLE